jgi:hypothetical protein
MGGALAVGPGRGGRAHPGRGEATWSSRESTVTDLEAPGKEVFGASPGDGVEISIQAIHGRVDLDPGTAVTRRGRGSSTTEDEKDNCGQNGNRR